MGTEEGKGAKADGWQAGWSPFQRAPTRLLDLFEFSWVGAPRPTRTGPGAWNLGSDSRVGCGGPGATTPTHFGSACLASAKRDAIGWLLKRCKEQSFKNSGPSLLLEKAPFPFWSSVTEDLDGVVGFVEPQPEHQHLLPQASALHAGNVGIRSTACSANMSGTNQPVRDDLGSVLMRASDLLVVLTQYAIRPESNCLLAPVVCAIDP